VRWRPQQRTDCPTGSRSCVAVRRRDQRTAAVARPSRGRRMNALLLVSQSAATASGVATGWQWREPLWLLLSVMVVFVCYLRHRQRGTLWLAAARNWQPSSDPLPVTMRQRLAGLPWLLEGLGLTLLVLALARPVVIAAEPPARLGRDVLLCFDRSSSMAAQDLDRSNGDRAGSADLRPSRLTVGKQLAAEFLARRSDDRLGIVTFARYADLVCPPTLDHVAVAELLASVQLVDAEGPEDATAIGAAVGMAANLLQRSAASGKVIVLLTDGEENVATAGAPD